VKTTWKKTFHAEQVHFRQGIRQSQKGSAWNDTLSKGACIEGNLAQNVVIVKKSYFIVLLPVLLLWGCDNGPTDPEQPNDSSDANVSLAPEVVEPGVVVSPESPSPPNTSLPVPIAPEGPQAPAFTKELLTSVKNWTAVPPSVFPLYGVTLKQPLNFEIKTPSGQVIGSFPRAAGDEVVALALVGNQLHVSPAKTSKQRNVLSVDETDFKTCVAYLFEVRKRQREAYEAELVRRSSVASSRPATDSFQRQSTSAGKNISSGKPQKPSGRGTLFEDIPPPMDVGHGKFCICGDCRQKRKNAQK